MLRTARVEARLSQSELAERLGVSQPAVARLESPEANPRLATLERALHGCGRRLKLSASAESPSIDATLVARNLALAPGDRVKSFERAYNEVRRIALAGRRARGELA